MNLEPHNPATCRGCRMRDDRSFAWERRPQKQPWLSDKNLWRLALVAALAAIVTALYVFTPVVRAEPEMRWQDVHTTEQACAWAKAHPGVVVNEEELLANCI